MYVNVCVMGGGGSGWGGGAGIHRVQDGGWWSCPLGTVLVQSYRNIIHVVEIIWSMIAAELSLSLVCVWECVCRHMFVCV